MQSVMPARVFLIRNNSLIVKSQSLVYRTHGPTSCIFFFGRKIRLLPRNTKTFHY